MISAILLFGSIVLHELGHALAARRLGIGIASIDLWLFGGLAKMERDTRTAGEEFKVAAAGPAVTLVIAVVCFGLAALLSGAGTRGRRRRRSRRAAPARPWPCSAGSRWSTSACSLFNLIPGFPLDGGRIARAIAWKVTGDRTRATRFATRMGRGVAYLMIGAGLFIAIATGDVFGGLWLAVIGLFLGSAARQSEYQNEVQSRIEGVRVADVMDAEPVALPVRADPRPRLGRVLPALRLALVPGGRRRGPAGRAWWPRSRSSRCPSRSAPGRNVASVMAADSGGGGACGWTSTSRSRRCWAARAWPAWARSWPSTARACCAAW